MLKKAFVCVFLYDYAISVAVCGQRRRSGGWGGVVEATVEHTEHPWLWSAALLCNVLALIA